MDPRLFLVVAGIAGAAWLQPQLGESNAMRRTNDFRYTPDPRIVRFLAGSDRSTVADVIWLGALPDMSRPFRDLALKKRWLAAATDVVTDLDPAFFSAYSISANYLLRLDKNPEDAIRLLRKGIEHNPDSAGLHVALAMIYYMDLKDTATAVALLEKASTMPGIDSLSIAMLAAMKVDARDDFVAIACWARALEEAPNAKVRAICEYELWRTKALIANRASRDYATDHGGSPPKTAADVRDPKLMSESVFDVVLDGLEYDPAGRARYAKMLELERAVRIFQAADVTAALVAGEGRLPTEKEFLAAFGSLPDPPPGQKWKYEAGKLSLVAE